MGKFFVSWNSTINTTTTTGTSSNNNNNNIVRWKINGNKTYVWKRSSVCPCVNGGKPVYQRKCTIAFPVSYV